MEKMNQVSVTEFMSKSKEEMYDMAVEMVEKYNRLVDICNDSAERIADLIERHSVYTNALNKDIADKAAKIELLEKEIEGRKEGYTALKKRMDTDYISIEEHNDICKTYEDKVAKLEKESEKWQDLAKMNRDTICNQYDVCEDFKKKIAELEEKVKHQKENLDGINKTLEIKTKENERLIAVKNKRIIELKRTIEKCKDYDTSLIDSLRINNDDLKKQVEYLKKELDMTLVDEFTKKNDEIKKLKEENAYLKKESENKNEMIRKAYVRYVDEACKSREEIMNDCYKMLAKDDTGYIGFKQYSLGALEAQEGNEETAEEFLCDAIELIFYNKKAEEKREEETKKELNEAFGVPCGEDAIE